MDFKDIEQKYKEHEVAKTSTPCAPDTSKFSATHYGYIRYCVANTYNPFIEVEGIQVGSNVSKEIHKAIAKEVRQIVGSKEYIETTGTAWSMYGKRIK